jgi:XisI protein
MDKLLKYQDILEQFLEEEAAKPCVNQGLEAQVLADRKRGHFQLFICGWEKKKLVRQVEFHFDLKPDGKIWVQENATELQIADELMARGVDKMDIVLGFLPPHQRRFSGFAAA